MMIKPESIRNKMEKGNDTFDLSGQIPSKLLQFAIQND